MEEKFKYIYANLKSQAAYLFAQKIINREISIEPTLLERKFSGKGFEKVPLRQILDKERKAIRKDEDSEEKRLDYYQEDYNEKISRSFSRLHRSIAYANDF